MKRVICKTCNKDYWYDAELGLNVFYYDFQTQRGPLNRVESYYSNPLFALCPYCERVGEHYAKETEQEFSNNAWEIREPFLRRVYQRASEMIDDTVDAHSYAHRALMYDVKQKTLALKLQVRLQMNEALFVCLQRKKPSKQTT